MDNILNEAKINVFKEEINYIKNDRYKESIRTLISLLPDYFFEVPASSSGKYHPLFALGDGGLVRHTKVAVRMAKEMFDDESLTGAYTNNKKDLMIKALNIHKRRKKNLQKSTNTKFKNQ